MFHHPDCQKYKQWKREQAKKSKSPKKKVKKSKERELVLDCLDDEHTQSPEVLHKIDSSKCKQKRERRRRRIKLNSLKGVIIKEIPPSEVYLKKIKPSVEVRERLLNPRHMRCLYDTASESDIAIINDELTRRALTSQMGATRDRRRSCKAKGQRRRKSRRDSKQTKGMKRKGEDESGEESTQKVKGRPKRKQGRRKVVTRERDSESEDSECDSICSFDSEVCLAGLKITAADKKKLKAQAQESNNEKKN